MRIQHAQSFSVRHNHLEILESSKPNFPGAVKMPCHIPSHTHDWAPSGTLSIAKCESRCGFCTSTKDYKPASALRKVLRHRSPKAECSLADIVMQHALTHIKNDVLPLTLEKSTGGRPRL